MCVRSNNITILTLALADEGQVPLPQTAVVLLLLVSTVSFLLHRAPKYYPQTPEVVFFAPLTLILPGLTNNDRNDFSSSVENLKRLLTLEFTFLR